MRFALTLTRHRVGERGMAVKNGGPARGITRDCHGQQSARRGNMGETTGRPLASSS